MKNSRFTMKFWMRRVRDLFMLFGVLAFLAGGYVVYRQGIPSPWLLKKKLSTLAGRATKGTQAENLFSPKDMYKAHAFEGTLKKGHPRVLFPSTAAYEQLRARYLSDKRYHDLVDAQAKGKSLQGAVVAWACREDREAGRFGIAELLRRNLKEPTDAGEYNDALDYALAYDLLAGAPDWDETSRDRVELKLAEYVRSGLKVLDGKSASMWHGRAALSSTVWVAAVVLDGPFQDLSELRRRAQAHFVATLKAAAFSEGWPEGYNYWINGRAFLLAAACAAQVHGVEAPELNKWVKAVLVRIGMWTIHGTEPGGRFHLFGDTGPRNDLKDETQRAIDLIALLTDSLIFKDYSRYLYGRHRVEGYYPPYRWAAPLLRGPMERDFAPAEALPDLSTFEGVLPTSAVFGRESLGQVFIRSSWNRDATFISFQAGHALAHHGHYQAGHFTIFKKAPLAITSGNYGKFFEEHRLNYYLRTVAANSLLVLKPGEKVHPNRFFTENVADGGQRLVMPTESAVLSVEDWKENLYAEEHYEGGRITSFDNGDPRFVYVASDLTRAYNNTRYDENNAGGKVSDVYRQMVYLRDDDLVLVYDRVVSTDQNYTKKWLLHSWGRPETAHEKVLVGTPDNGILETSDARVRIKNGEGVLDVLRLLPDDAVIRKVGGPGYRYYVEADGDDSDLDGRNMDGGAKEESWYDSGMWRIEIQPLGKRRDDRFLVALAPRTNAEESLVKIEMLPAEGAVAVTTPSAVVLFSDDKRVRYDSPAGAKRLHLLAGLPAGKKVRVALAGEAPAVKTAGDGSLSFETEPGPARTIVLERLD